jgi:hypothetical protein
MPTRRRLLDPHWLTRGLSELRARMWTASWWEQNKEEKRRRMQYVRQLGRELDKIERHSIFATRLGEFAIEAVIEGDLTMLREWADQLSFAQEAELVRRHAEPAWRTFRSILLSAVATWPGEDKKPSS